MASAFREQREKEAFSAISPIMQAQGAGVELIPIYICIVYNLTEHLFPQLIPGSKSSSATFDSCKWALDRLGVECLSAANPEAAQAALRAGADSSHAPCLAIVDARGGKGGGQGIEQAEAMAR